MGIEQLLLHGIGDYIIQNDWMGTTKKKKGWMGFLACLIHCVTYSLPFLLIGTYTQVFLIFITHFIIDRYHLVDYFGAIKNNVKNSFTYDISNWGFKLERPKVLTLWLYIITDNIFHLIINYLILKYL